MSASLRTTVYTTYTAPSARPLHLAVSSSLQTTVYMTYTAPSARPVHLAVSSYDFSLTIVQRLVKLAAQFLRCKRT